MKRCNGPVHNVQLASLIPERFAFYDVFSGYFDLLKVSLKVQPRSRASGFKQILVGSTNKISTIIHFDQGVSKLGELKGRGQKKLRHFGFEATFFASLCSESLLSERPRFDPWRAQSLGTHSFVAPEPN